MLPDLVRPDDRCPCDSMKKYKRCHGPPPLIGPPLDPDDPDRFDKKGKYAENVLHALAEGSFMTDWCFPRPPRPNNEEFCDLLVHYDDRLLLWQVKDIEVDKQGQYDQKKRDKNVRQLGGARRFLLDQRVPLTLENGRRQPERFDASKVRRTHLLSVIMGSAPKGPSPLNTFLNGQLVHHLWGPSLEIMLRELDTISDFVAYLDAKEALVEGTRGRVVIEGAEEQHLLAYYLAHGRSFEPLFRLTENETMVMRHGSWERFTSSDRYVYRVFRNRLSYYWDDLIDSAHTMRQPFYERIARELARPGRLARRQLAVDIFEIGRQALDLWKTRAQDTLTFWPRFQQLDGRTYVLLFHDPSLSGEEARLMLHKYTLVATDRYATKDRKALGVSVAIGTVNRVSFALVDEPDWTETDHVEAEEWRNVLGLKCSSLQNRGTDYEFEDPPQSPSVPSPPQAPRPDTPDI